MTEILLQVNTEPCHDRGFCSIVMHDVFSHFTANLFSYAQDFRISQTFTFAGMFPSSPKTVTARVIKSNSEDGLLNIIGNVVDNYLKREVKKAIISLVKVEKESCQEHKTHLSLTTDKELEDWKYRVRKYMY